VKKIISKIDRAVKRLYNIDFKFKAENFLLHEDADPEVNDGLVESGKMDAALVLKTMSEKPADVSLGIFLNSALRDILPSLKGWHVEKWNHEQVSAFITTSEEISHFNYFLFPTLRKRKVSQLELELQGDVDKFFLMFFALARGKKASPEMFDLLYEQLFMHFRLKEGLSEEQQERYRDANNFAKAFILKCRPLLIDRTKFSQAIENARKFYRLDNAGKISWSVK
jgi:hypothetical protein